MAKMTLTQKRRMLDSIKSKTNKLLFADVISTQDFLAMNKIVGKYKNKLK